jgi:hypothetical protein
MSGSLRPRQILAVLVAAAIGLVLALPAAASAAEEPLNIQIVGEGEVSCKVSGGEAEACEAEYPAGTHVTLVPEPVEGYVLGAWGLDCSATPATANCALTMSAAHNVSATFNPKQFKLKRKASGSGQGVVKCSTGGPFGSCAAEYPFGTELTLSAEPNEGSEFGGWTLEGSEFGAGTDCEEPEEAECELTVEEETTVTATFDLEPALGIEIKGSGKGEGAVECEFEASREACRERYPSNAEVFLFAEAGPQAEFKGWGGACASAGTAIECALTMEGPQSVSASFESTVEYTLEIEATGPGTVVGSPGSIHCPGACSAHSRTGAKVTLTATPAPGSFFDGWAGGGCKGIVATCTVTIGGDTTVAAEFEPRPPPDAEEEETLSVVGTAKAAPVAQVKAGKAALKLSCAGGPCEGTLKLGAKIRQGGKTKSIVAGGASFRLAAGASKTIEVALAAPVKRELGKGKVVVVKLSGMGVAAATVRLVPAKTHKSL